MGYGETLLIYVAMLTGIMVIPGADMAFVAGNGLAAGRRAGLAALAGIALGGAAHTLIWSLGIGALLARAPIAFMALTLAGAAYLAWIGFSLIAATRGIIAPADQTPPSRRFPAPSQSISAILRRGITTCLLNPKAHLFMAAVFPQFLRNEFGPIWRQAAVLGVMGVSVQGAVYGGVLALTLGGRQALSARPGVLRGLLLAVGAGFVLGGLLAAALAAGRLIG